MQKRASVTAAVAAAALLAGGLAAANAVPTNHPRQSATPDAALAKVNPVATKAEVKALTADWKGARLPDGRPKVSDDILERMKVVSIEQAWGYLDGEGWETQYAGDWKTLHSDRTVIGRALTAQFMPSNPGLEKRMTDAGHAAGHKGQMNTWPIEMLNKGDVYVADGFGKVEDGTLIGGNLGNTIYARSGNGVVFDGTVRDREELEQIDGFNAYVRGYHPSYIKNMMLTGANTTTRIGEAVVLPGDVVLAKKGGVVFIPAQLARPVVEDAEVTLLRDTFTKQRLEEGTYETGELDKGWDEVDPEIRRDFVGWLEENRDDLPVPPERVDEIRAEEEAALES